MKKKWFALFIAFWSVGSALDVTWTQVLPNLSSTSSQPVISQFSDGSAVAIWTESAGLALKAASFNPSTKAWGTSVTIATSTVAITDYSLKTDRSNVVLGMWLQSSALGSAGEPRAAQYTKSTDTWVAVPSLWNVDSLLTPFEQPSVALLGNNLALFSATQEFSVESLVFWERFRFYNYNTQTLQIGNAVDTLHNQFYSANIGKTGSSQAITVYIQCAVNTDADYSVAAALLTPSTTVNILTTISAVGVNNTIPLAVGSNLNGQAVCAWVQGGDVYASYLTSFSSNTWASPNRLTTSGTITTAPLCAMDDQGNAVVGWLDTQEGVGVFQVSFFSATSLSWSSNSNVSLTTSSASSPAVAANAGGLFGFVWSQGGVLLSRFYQKGVWSPALSNQGLQLPGSSTGTFASVALSSVTSPQGVCAWQGMSVDSAYLTNAFTGLSPAGQQVLIRYPVQGDLVNQLRWSANPDAATYQIYRDSLSQLIGQTTGASYDDHQRVPSQVVTYYIQSLNSLGVANGDLASVTVQPISISQ